MGVPEKRHLLHVPRRLETFKKQKGLEVAHLKLRLATIQSGIKEIQDCNWNVPADSDIHRYDTQGRGNYQTRRHRTLVYEQSAS